MCLAIPGRVAEVGPEWAEVAYGERRRRASTLLMPDIRVGEYVLVSGGMIVDRLSEEEAQERLALFDELAEVLDEVE